MNTKTEALKAQMTGSVARPKPSTLHGFLELYKSEIARALPHHMSADRMARIALTEVRKTPALAKADPASVFGAVIQASQLGLEPGGALGHCYLIPFENRKKNITECQFMIGYRGMIDLARRSGQILSITAHAVYEGDRFDCRLGLHPDLVHEPDWNNPNRGDAAFLRFVYAVANLKDGGVQFAVMSRGDVEAIRSRSKAGNYGPWATDFEAMALKTVIRRLFKFLPVSVEITRAVALDEMADANVTQDNSYVIEGAFSDPLDDRVFDAEGVEVGAPDAATRGEAVAGNSSASTGASNGTQAQDSPAKGKS